MKHPSRKVSKKLEAPFTKLQSCHHWTGGTLVTDWDNAIHLSHIRDTNSIHSQLTREASAHVFNHHYNLCFACIYTTCLSKPISLCDNQHSLKFCPYHSPWVVTQQNHPLIFTGTLQQNAVLSDKILLDQGFLQQVVVQEIIDLCI